MTLLIGPGYVLPNGVFQRDRKWDGDHDPRFTSSSGRCLSLVPWRHLDTDRPSRRSSSITWKEGWLPISSRFFFPFRGEERSQMRIDGKAWLDRVY